MKSLSATYHAGAPQLDSERCTAMEFDPNRNLETVMKTLVQTASEAELGHSLRPLELAKERFERGYIAFG